MWSHRVLRGSYREIEPPGAHCVRAPTLWSADAPGNSGRMYIVEKKRKPVLRISQTGQRKCLSLTKQRSCPSRVLPFFFLLPTKKGRLVGNPRFGWVYQPKIW